jgi:hypothetical protein
MLKFFKSFFKKTHEPEAAPEAPYKVEAPVAEPAKCGCGRSPTGHCVGLHKLTAEEWAGHVDNPNKVTAAPIEKKPAAKKTPAKKPAVEPKAKKPAAQPITKKPVAAKPTVEKTPRAKTPPT